MEALTSISRVTDAHVHLMPEDLLRAIRNVLTEEIGWSFDPPITQTRMESALKSAGINRYFALPYAHKPEIARDLNEWVLTASERSEMVVPFATVHGEDEVESVVRDAFRLGSRGLKFQCPVQQCGPTDERLTPAFELAAEYDRPILFHAGTAPVFEDSPHVGADSFKEFVESYPDIRACAAHMGTFEVDEFVNIARTYDSVFLDTAFVLSEAAGDAMGFDPRSISDTVYEELSSSIMYGTDYPNIIFPYRDELDALLQRDLSEAALRDILNNTSSRFLGE